MSETAIRVLYVDDDLALARLAQRALGRLGFAVEHASSADAAMTRIVAGGIDVVALDHYLETGTGLDFLARLQAIEKAPPVVYVTGSTEMDVAVAALKAGATDFVPKTVGDDFLILLGSALEQSVGKARLTAAKEAAEQEVRIARDRAEVLLTEVNHRVANSLSLVSSLVSLQANAISDQVAKDALAETQARIYAISLVHKRLYSSGNVHSVDLDEYLAGLLEHLDASTRGDGQRVAISSRLDPLTLATDATINLGVVVTEWVTNALKYAYPVAPGEVRVTLSRRPDGRGELAVEDDGVGRSHVGAVKGTGLGTRIVKAMAISMAAEVDYIDRAPGTTARIVFALGA